MENNPELRLAWQFIENTGTHLFLTGKAGTGKTTFLRQLKAKSPKRMVVLAPTGIAAINAGGVTIHSFFQLPLAPFVPEATFSSAQAHYRFSKEKRRIIRSMDLLVIDEVSMVRADLLDAVDAVLLHQANRFMLDHLARKCRIPAEKMLLDMEEGGNTVSNTIPVTLSRKLHRGELRHGQKILLAGFGVGLSAAATVVEL